jgi:hypothetical protein
MDLQFWYGSAFGSPTARVQGLGWLQEFVARLTHTPIAVYVHICMSSAESTFNS